MTIMRALFGSPSRSVKGFANRCGLGRLQTEGHAMATTIRTFLCGFVSVLWIASAAGETVLRAREVDDLKGFDPIYTSDYMVREHGYMVYDTLFAMDEGRRAGNGGSARQKRPPNPLPRLRWICRASGGCACSFCTSSASIA